MPPIVRRSRGRMFAALSLIVVSFVGCLPDGAATGGGENAGGTGPFDDAVDVALLKPFQGTWRYDFDHSAAVWESQGVPAEQIAASRKFRENPALAALGGTLTVDGHVATGVPFAFSEYRFFGLHEHDGAVCGKAWHHEDADDPGDMSKCYVKLRRVGEELHFDVWMAEEMPDLDDPDLTGSPAVVSGSADDCDAPPDDGDNRNGWSTSVFVPAPPG